MGPATVARDFRYLGRRLPLAANLLHLFIPEPVMAQAGGETDADAPLSHRDEAQSLGAQREIHDSGKDGAASDRGGTRDTQGFSPAGVGVRSCHWREQRERGLYLPAGPTSVNQPQATSQYSHPGPVTCRGGGGGAYLQGPDPGTDRTRLGSVSWAEQSYGRSAAFGLC